MTDDIIIGEAVRLGNEGNSVTLPVKGGSMLPFIIGWKESVILQKPTHPRWGDVVLAWVDGCRYVVHRIICIDGDRVTLMGDGNVTGTEHCTVSDIKAVATHVVGADGQPHDLYNRWQCQRAKGWYWLRPVRRYLLWLYRKGKNIKR